jgi:hypothetical protein
LKIISAAGNQFFDWQLFQILGVIVE